MKTYQLLKGIKGYLWLTRRLSIIEMKTDNELAIGGNTGHSYARSISQS